MDLDVKELTSEGEFIAMVQTMVELYRDPHTLLGPVYPCKELEAKDGTISTSTLINLGLTSAAAYEFCLSYNRTKRYYQNRPKLHQGLAKLRELMVQEERPPRLIALNATIMPGLTLFGLIMGCSSLSHWCYLLNTKMSLRALLCATLPQLPAPPFFFEPQSCSEMLAGFYMNARRKPASFSLRERHYEYQQEHFGAAWLDFIAQYRAPLTFLKPQHGLLSGAACKLHTPRLVTLCAQSGAYINSMELAAFYNCTRPQCVELRAPQNTAEQWSDEVLPLLKANLAPESSLLFIATTPEQLPPGWLEGIVHHGHAYFIAPETYFDDQYVRATISKVFGSRLRRKERCTFISRPYQYLGTPVTTTICAIRLEYIAKNLEQRFTKHLPMVRTFIMVERSALEAETEAKETQEIALDPPVTQYFVTNLDCEGPEHFEHIVCALSEYEQVLAGRKLLLDKEALAQIEAQMRLPSLIKIITAHLTETSPQVAPEFADMGEEGAKLSATLHKWSGIYHYVAGLKQ